MRYNPYHDPTNGRFTSGSGGNGGYLFVGKGQKGKGMYVVDSNSEGNSSKLRNMSSEQREDFMAAYNLSGKDFKETHTVNQAYDAALERYKQFGGQRIGDSAAVKGMEFLQKDISESMALHNKQRHEELRQEYLKLLPKNADGRFERQMINLMSISNEALEQKIKALKGIQTRAFDDEESG